MRFDEEQVLIGKDVMTRVPGVVRALWVMWGLAALATAPALANEAPTMAPAPAWVVADAVPDSVPGAGGLRYELVSDQIDLTGRAARAYRRLSYTVLRAKSLDEAGQISIDYQPQYQTLALNSLEVWRDGKRIDMRNRAHYARLRRESGLEDGLIDGALTVSITLPDLRVGDRVDYGVTITGSNPVFGKGYHDVFDARYGVPLGERRVRLRYPSGLALQWRIGAPGFSRSVDSADGITTLSIAASRIAAMQPEKDAPDDVDPYGLIEVSTAGNWAAVADWAAQLYPDAFKDRQVAAGMVQSLQLRRDDPQGALLRAVAFVQGEIRYVGLDMGENSHAPHAPEVTLRNRYGDCKDKATLLIALLQLAGIRAEPVLVSSDRGSALDKRLPSPYAFDHVVVRAHLPQGEVWVDATRDREDGPLAQRRPLPFVRGLPVLAGQDALVAVPSPMPALPQVEVNEDIVISLRTPQRVATFSVDTIYRQGRGERVAASFENDGAETIGAHYLEFMQQYYTALTQVEAPTIDATDPLNVRTRERYRLQWPAEEGDKLGFALFQLSDWMDSLPRQARTSPLALGGPRLARQTVRVQVDPPVQLKADTQTVSNPWFRFTRTISQRDGRIVIVGQWQRFSDRIPADGVTRAAADMERARVGVLRSRPRATAQQAVNRLARAGLSAGRVAGAAGGGARLSGLVAPRWTGRDAVRPARDGAAHAAAGQPAPWRLGGVRTDHAGVGMAVVAGAAVVAAGCRCHRRGGAAGAGLRVAHVCAALDGQCSAGATPAAGDGGQRAALAGLRVRRSGGVAGPGGVVADRGKRSGRHGAGGDGHPAVAAGREDRKSVV